VADIAQIKAQLMAASTKLHEACGPLRQGHQTGYEAHQMLHGAMEGTSQHDFSECIATIDCSMQHVDDAMKYAFLAADQAEAMAARL
jgi:hypothetical protein